MTTGVGTLQYPKQPAPKCDLRKDDSYFLVRLHNAQAFFEASWLSKVGYLLFTSSVEGSFQPTATHSLYKIAAVKKNTPAHLGIGINLTDFLPANTGESMRINLKYVVAQDTPFKQLADKMSAVDLAAKVSLVRPDWTVAVKVSEIVAHLLSFFVGEGSKHDIFTLTMDLNLADLQSGYYAIVGSHNDATWPVSLEVDANGRLLDQNHNELSHLSYAMIEVLAVPRLGDEATRNQPWWALLQEGKDEALYASGKTAEEISAQWLKRLQRVKVMAREDRRFLLKEVNEVIQKAHNEVEQKLLATGTSQESFGDIKYPETWQDVLGVSTNYELQQSVQDYETALELSQQLLVKYNLTG